VYGAGNGVSHFILLEDGTMPLNAHLNFSGQCEEAFPAIPGFFGGKISIMMTYRFGMLVDRYGIPWRVNCGKTSS